jgi:hypothetical protein
VAQEYDWFLNSKWWSWHKVRSSQGVLALGLRLLALHFVLLVLVGFNKCGVRDILLEVRTVQVGHTLLESYQRLTNSSVASSQNNLKPKIQPWQVRQAHFSEPPEDGDVLSEKARLQEGSTVEPVKALGFTKVCSTCTSQDYV